MKTALDNHHDDRLIQLTLSGSREAFGVLVSRHQNRLFNGLAQMLRDPCEAEDVVQEAFLLALRKLHTFKGNSKFFTWLYRIAYNVAITRMRRQKPSVSIYDNDDGNAFQISSDQPTPDSGMIADERANILAATLSRLSDEHRDILILREMEEMDYAEISEVLDLPVGTVRSRLHRARLQLKELLEQKLS